jgi:hypothetical protein
MSTPPVAGGGNDPTDNLAEFIDQVLVPVSDVVSRAVVEFANVADMFESLEERVETAAGEESDGQSLASDLGEVDDILAAEAAVQALTAVREAAARAAAEDLPAVGRRFAAGGASFKDMATERSAALDEAMDLLSDAGFIALTTELRTAEKELGEVTSATEEIRDWLQTTPPIRMQALARTLDEASESARAAAEAAEASRHAMTDRVAALDHVAATGSAALVRSHGDRQQELKEFYDEVKVRIDDAASVFVAGLTEVVTDVSTSVQFAVDGLGVCMDGLVNDALETHRAELETWECAVAEVKATTEELPALAADVARARHIAAVAEALSQAVGS